jgi:periodic tryptophan protein 2
MEKISSILRFRPTGCSCCRSIKVCQSKSDDQNADLKDGRALLANVPRRTVLHRISFKSQVSAVAFSPCGRFVAVALRHKHLIQVWRTPAHGLAAVVQSINESAVADSNQEQTRDFSPFVLHRTYSGHYDAISSIVWSKDSQWFLSTSKDLTIRIYTREPLENYKPITLAGHRDAVVGAWFSDDGESVYSVGRDGSCFTWTKSDDNADAESTMSTTGHVSYTPGTTRFILATRNYFNQKGAHGPARVKSAQFHIASNLLVIGFSTGVFGLYEMPDFNNIHTLR